MTPEDWHTTHALIKGTEPVQAAKQHQKAHDAITAIQRAHGLIGRGS